ncbi:hypothetical protein B0H19DRAFT_1083823 [Mycena capillaripes]|nr:hypothetical protein B0H19DRAFT_1083823 [Mycena capillaripes]
MDSNLFPSRDSFSPSIISSGRFNPRRQPGSQTRSFRYIYTIHTSLRLQSSRLVFFQDKIEGNARILFADPSLPAYKDDRVGPNKLLMDMVLAHGWGFTVEMQDNKSTMDALGSYIGRVSIAKRNTIKGVIATSLGSAPAEGEKLRPGALNIVQLTTKILQKLHVKAKVDVAFCGRVAILIDEHVQRKLISESTDNLEVFGTVQLKSLASTTGITAVPVPGPSRVPPSTENDDDDEAA